VTAPAPAELDLAVKLAVDAGDLLLRHRRDGTRGVDTKTTGTDMVSDADRAAEALIVEGLAADFPEDGLLGEEGSASRGTSGRTWVVDPLDGTTNFLYGQDGFCVSIALEDEAGAMLGCVHDPLRAETFTAWRGGGSWMNDRRLSASSTASLAEALVGTGFSYRSDQREWQARVVGRLLPRIRDVRRRGAAALDLCWVGAGRLDAHVERGLAPWDHAAGLLVAAEAGAEVRPVDRSDPWPLVVAAAPGVAEALFAEVDGAEAEAGGRPT